MKILSKRQILMLHAALAARAGSLDGLRDEGLLDSAIHAPMQTFGGQELYPSTLEKAARLGYGLIRNHPFADGNKRIGTHAMLVFLAINGVTLSYEDEELISGEAYNTICELSSAPPPAIWTNPDFSRG